MMRALKRLALRGRQFLIGPILEKSLAEYSPDVIGQVQLQLTYQALAGSGSRLPSLGQVGFRVFSQTDEDGILLFIFSLIGTVNKKCVEICAGNGIECNTANLIISHGWSGLLVDGNAALVKEGREFYARNRCTRIYPPAFIHSWVTRGNIDDLVRDNGFEGEIDLLSIDMDGMDYWIWEALSVIDPRVVVVEYQDILGPDRSLTVPYADDFTASKYPTTRGMPNFCGASLPAFVKLASQRGYRLVGCNRYGYNAFFIKNPLGEREIPETQIAECFRHPKVRWGMQERFPTISDFPWVEV